MNHSAPGLYFRKFCKTAGDSGTVGICLCSKTFYVNEGLQKAFENS